MPKTCSILIATGNPHKVEEIGAVLSGYVEGLELLSLKDVGCDIPEPEEDRGTFAGNAAVKAVAYAKATGMLCLADDSGLVVDALHGDPGVDSAYYAQDQKDLPGAWGAMARPERDEANNRKLLGALEGVEKAERTARFVCTMVLASSEPVTEAKTEVTQIPLDLRPNCLALVVGEVAGRILLPEEAADPEQAHRGRGSHGFGYDPLFLLSEDAPYPGLTTAELSPEDKNAISHRGRACAKLVVFGVV